MTALPGAAETALPEFSVGAPKGVAEGVLSALRPEPHTSDGRDPEVGGKAA
ncbi:hypothetical protein G6045_14050 [Streptomyces sp. YC504]|uniref:Uncharacterized protein n=1 Tax=Streptomyces mesophilus TaxID=1775132 RepID=A0A6G4XIW0_9ACTN|nr:hypothetical protein [Streptomyces mesophilus]NGO76780.1 hypothetical protein [Streptomyces mesophilus]